MSSLKEQLIRLGYQNPDLRNDLRPVLNAITASNKTVGREKKAHSLFDSRTENQINQILEHYGYIVGPGHLQSIDMGNRSLEIHLDLMRADTGMEGPLVTMMEAQDIAFLLSEELGARSYDVRSERGGLSDYKVLLEFVIA